MNTLVSVIVPCYNQAHYLQSSLQSLLEQIYTNWECIIVNDGSPDNTEEIAKQWCKKDKRFSYISKQNGGLSSARNAGIAKSKGDFILPLDADDLLHPKYLQLTVPLLQKSDNIAIVSCFSQFFDGDKDNVIHQLKPVGTTVHAILFENELIATSLYRKASWVEVGGYDETMKNGFEDWEFWLSILKSGKEYRVVDEFLFYYRKAKASMLVDTLENHRETNMEYIMLKHKDLYIAHYDNTIKYLFYLLNSKKKTETKLKSSAPYRVAKILSQSGKYLGRSRKKD
ncbi:MAG: glycosyltransferase family 2 protein [Bacteroidia bacterium]|nr:glycosyltransferase family 2 protein [Bacteroidia bacterium]